MHVYACVELLEMLCVGLLSGLGNNKMARACMACVNPSNFSFQVKSICNKS